MESVHIIAGDFGRNKTAFVTSNRLQMSSAQIGKGQIAALEVTTAEDIKKMSGAIGWGLVGGLAFGVIGGIAGVLAGGWKKEIVFVCKLSDDRKFLGKCNPSAYTMLQSLAMATPATAAPAKLTKTEFSISAELRAACAEGRHYACGSRECSCECHIPKPKKPFWKI
jgi:hypothetical protein